jgi:hypothetical protein
MYPAACNLSPAGYVVQSGRYTVRRDVYEMSRRGRAL